MEKIYKLSIYGGATTGDYPYDKYVQLPHETAGLLVSKSGIIYDKEDADEVRDK